MSLKLLNRLVKIASVLDQLGHHAEASEIDAILFKLANHQPPIGTVLETHKSQWYDYLDDDATYGEARLELLDYFSERYSRFTLRIDIVDRKPDRINPTHLRLTGSAIQA